MPGDIYQQLPLFQDLSLDQLQLLRPIFMPCTEKSFAIVSASLSGPLRRRVLIMRESELDDTEFPKRIREHVEAAHAERRAR